MSPGAEDVLMWEGSTSLQCLQWLCSALLCSVLPNTRSITCCVGFRFHLAPPGLAKKSLGKSTELSEEFRNRKLINLN